MKRVYSVLCLPLLALPAMSSAAKAPIDPYGFYLEGFQGADSADASMMAVLASIWDQLPENTVQQQDLKYKLANKFASKFGSKVEAVIYQLPRLKNLQDECTSMKKGLTTDFDSCHVMLGECKTSKKSLDDQKKTLDGQIRTLEDIKVIKENLEKKTGTFKNAEELYNQTKNEEAEALAEYLKLLKDEHGTSLISKVLDRITHAYQAHESAIKALRDACENLGTQFDPGTDDTHEAIKTLIELHTEKN